MRRSAITIAIIASLIAPVQALGAAIGCDTVTVASCCCPKSASDASTGDDAREDGATSSAVEGVCCCEVEPVGAPVPVAVQAAMTSLSSLSPPMAPMVAVAPRPGSANAEHSPAPARAPPRPASTLLDQQVAFLL